MAGFKLNRTSEDIRRELMDILRSMKDPRISGGMISVVRIDLTNDLSHCKVYISSLEGMEKAKEAVKVLTKAGGFIRHEMM
ncbi:MAG: 30S ribosome-binding factor RbfA, partial [Oscillospiraceae bacterium]|nr:30S ribosome-binding factor RbfA [Oscillospiraceae bacterium]